MIGKYNKVVTSRRNKQRKESIEDTRMKNAIDKRYIFLYVMEDNCYCKFEMYAMRMRQISAADAALCRSLK